MAERDGAAVHVHAIPVPTETLSVRERLCGEGLVRLDQVVVADLPAALLHQVLHGEDWREEEVLRFRSAGRVARYPREDLDPVCARILLGGHDQRGPAIVEARCV